MANYLERVASSAGRRAAIAKPPSSGPPLLPGALPVPAEGLFPSDVEQPLEASSHERREPSRPEERAEIKPPLPVEVPLTSRTTEPREDVHPPEPKPRATQESLSSEPPFTVHLPKTLRPVGASKVPPPVAPEQPPPRAPLPASTEAGPISPVSEVTHSAEVDTTAPPVETKAPDADRGPEDQLVRQPPVRQPPLRQPPATPIKTEAPISETLPAPRVQHDDGPQPHSDRVEPAPRASSPVHLPPVVAGSAPRQEQSRITIGSLEVMVNNHPPVAPARPPSATASRSEQLNLEKRYLDRFRLRH